MPAENPHKFTQTEMNLSRTSETVTLWDIPPAEVDDFCALWVSYLESSLCSVRAQVCIVCVASLQ